MTIVATKATGALLTRVATHGRLTPMARRVETSHNSDMIMKIARNHNPDHLVLTASARKKIAARRQGRIPKPGPKPELIRFQNSGVFPFAIPISVNLRRVRSRSRTRAPKPARTKVPSTISKSAVRLRTIWIPSSASKSPAIAPIKSERVIRRMIRASMMTESVPRRATMNRQPNGLTPNMYSPIAIVHLPVGG